MKFKNKLKAIRDQLTLNTSGRLDFDTSDESYTNVTNNVRHWNYGKNLSFTNDEEYNKRLEQRNEWKLLREQNPPGIESELHTKSNGFFCDAPSNFQFKSILYATFDNDSHF